MSIILKLFYIFFKVGLFGFGGGYVILPMIFQEIQKLGIMSASEFSDVVALSNITPGPIAINAATYVGFKAAGIPGAITATIAVSLPSFIIITIIIVFLNKFRKSQTVGAILEGIKPATVGLIASTVVFFSQTSLFKEGFFSLDMFDSPLSYVSIPAVLIFSVSIFLTQKFKIGPIVITLLGGVLGILII